MEEHLMTRSTLSRPVGMLAAAVTTTAWGGQFVVGKSAFAYLDPVWLTALRYGAASVVFVAMLAVVEGRAGFRSDPRLLRVAVLGTIGFAGFNLLAYVGLTTTTPEAASLIVSTMPLITAFVLWARTGARPSRVTWWSSGVALLGVGLVLTDGDLSRLLRGGLGWGDLLILAGAASWVVYTTGASSVPDWSPLRYTAISSASGSVVILGIALGSTAAGWLRLPTVGGVAAAWWQLVYVALVAAVVAVLCWNAATRALGPQDAVLFINLVPVTAFAVEAVRGHAPRPGELLGAALTLGALVTSNALARRAGRARMRPALAPAASESLPRLAEGCRGA
jgi:drug/metabolite transporter (DMT)-like permease